MISARDGDHLVIVTQEDHAHLTGDLAAVLPVDGPLHAAMVGAARVHDNGWREADAAAQVDADGRPATFSSVDDDTYEAVWRRGIARAAAVDPLIGLLVGLHGARFFTGRRSDGMQELAREERDRQDGVLAELGLGGTHAALPREVRVASDRIAFLDALSLQMCGAIPRTITVRVDGTELTCTPQGATVVVDPWPFVVDSHEASIPVRMIGPGPYADAGALRQALATAPTEHRHATARPKES